MSTSVAAPLLSACLGFLLCVLTFDLHADVKYLDGDRTLEIVQYYAFVTGSPVTRLSIAAVFLLAMCTTAFLWSRAWLHSSHATLLALPVSTALMWVLPKAQQLVAEHTDSNERERLACWILGAHGGYYVCILSLTVIHTVKVANALAGAPTTRTERTEQKSSAHASRRAASGFTSGWRLCAAGSAFPMLVGLMTYMLAFVGKVVLRPDSPYAFVPGKPMAFTHAELGADVSAVFFMLNGACWANVHVQGLLGIVIAYFGLRRGERWAWWALLYVYAVAGGTDIAGCVHVLAGPSTINSPMLVAPVLAFSLGLAGLWRSRDALASSKVE